MQLGGGTWCSLREIWVSFTQPILQILQVDPQGCVLFNINSPLLIRKGKLGQFYPASFTNILPLISDGEARTVLPTQIF